MHCITASLPPEMVTALSVLFGNISLATCTLAPVTSRISLILLPPFPIRLPHWLAGTTSLKVMGGRGTVPGEIRLLRSWHQQVWQSGSSDQFKLTSSNLLQISVNALKIASVFPVTVTIRSGQVPSLMLIFAPLWELKILKIENLL